MLKSKFGFAAERVFSGILIVSVIVACVFGYQRVTTLVNYDPYRYDGPVLDQGQKPFCTSYATTLWAMLVRPAWSDQFDPDTMHYRACQLDGIIHINPSKEGTHHYATQRVLEEWRVAQGYRVTDSVAQGIIWLQNNPVLIAVQWHEGELVSMPYHKPNMLYVPSGKRAEGHEILCYAYESPDLLCQNSWGQGFADKGRFRINEQHLQTIVNEWLGTGDIMQPLEIWLAPVYGAK